MAFVAGGMMDRSSVVGQQTNRPQVGSKIRRQGSVRQSKLECEIELENTIYYDGDLIRGEVCLNAKEDGIYRNVLVLLLCRFIGRDPALTPKERCTTLHLSKYPLAAELHVPQGETKVPFEFSIPENVPPTFSSKWGDVVWMARLIHENPDTKSRMPLATLTKTLFEKRSIYYPLPGYEPTAQAERRLFRSGQVLRVEAKLAKDVHSPGEAVQVEVVLHQSISPHAKNMPKIAVKKIKAEIQQSIDSKKNGRKQVSKVYALETSKHNVSTWAVSRISDGTGVVADKTFSLRPNLDPRLKVAHQTTINSKSGEPETVLAATCKQHNSATNSGLEVKYAVQLKISVTGASDMTMLLPFVIESPKPNAVSGEVTAIDDEVRERMVFPVVDDPPEYHYHRSLSVPSYTSLRRNSYDSVFASPSLFDMTEDIIPSYNEAVSDWYEELARKGSITRGRRNTLSVGSLGTLNEVISGNDDERQPQVHHRRNSFAGLSQLLRRSSTGDQTRQQEQSIPPPIADTDEAKDEQTEEDHLAMLKLKYSNVRDRNNSLGPHSLSDAEIRALPSDRQLISNNWQE